MRARKPNTDQDAQVVFCVNGKVATEYDLPTTAATPRDDIAECFVPVEEGDRITIKGYFNGSVLNGAFDLVLDGSFLSDSRIDGTDLKLVSNRKLEFKKALNCPIPPGWTSIESPIQMEEGPMYTQGLDQQEYGDDTHFELASRECMKPGLGSVQVVIYVNQRPGDYYYDKYPDITIGHWRTRDSQLVRKSGILPEFELRIEVDDPEISSKRSAKHRRHWGATHFGYKPWARFVFYYRSEASIQAAGCVERSDHVQELEPGDQDGFIHAESKRKKKKQSSVASDEDDAALVTTITSPPSTVDRRPAQEQRQSPRKAVNRRLGGKLSLAQGRDDKLPAVEGYHAAQSDPINRSTMRAEEPSFAQLLAGYGEAERFTPLTSGRNHANTSDRPATDAAAAGGETSDEAMGLAFSSAAPDASHASANARDGRISPAAQTSLHRPSSNRAESSPPTKNNIDDYTTDMSHSNPSIAAVLRQVPSASTIRDSIPSEGLDEFGMHILFVNAGILHHEAEAAAVWERRKVEVAVKDPADGRWYRKPTPRRAGGTSLRKSALQGTQSTTSTQLRDSASHFQNTASQVPIEAPDPGIRFDDDNQDDTLQPDLNSVYIKQEEVDIDTTPASPAPVPDVSFTALPKSIGNAKRTASERTRSSPPGTQSPASKRAKKQSSARLKELQQESAAKAAKKEELARKLTARDEAKAAKAEEKRRKAEERRLEAERREADEIAELERANADYDEQLAAMERQLEEDDDEEADDDDDSMEEESEAE